MNVPTPPEPQPASSAAVLPPPPVPPSAVGAAQTVPPGSLPLPLMTLWATGLLFLLTYGGTFLWISDDELDEITFRIGVVGARAPELHVHARASDLNAEQFNNGF